MIRAQHINYTLGANQLTAVFSGVTRDLLSDIGGELVAEAKREVRVAVTNDSPPIGYIRIDVLDGDVRTAACLLKEVVQPELSCTFAIFTLKLLFCECNRVSIEPDGKFAEGLEPPDETTFWANYHKAVQALQVAELLGDEADEYSLITPMEELLKGLGVHVAVFLTQKLWNPVPCTHTS